MKKINYVIILFLISYLIEGAYFSFINPIAVWDDVLVAVNQVTIAGANPPVWEVIRNDGEVITTYAYDFDGDSYGSTADYAALDTTDLTLSFWIKPNNLPGDTYIMERHSSWAMRTRNDKLRMDIDGDRMTSDPVLIVGATSHVVIRCEDTGSGMDVDFFVDGQLIYQDTTNDQLTAETTGLTFGRDESGNDDYSDANLDEVNIYNLLLTNAQILEIYNNGAGITGQPTGIIQNSDVIARFQFEENTGTTADNNCLLGSTHDMTITNGEWATGLVGSTTGSRGVMALSFPPDRLAEVYFSVQFPHRRKFGSAVHPHIHWSIEGGFSDNDVVWGLEYVWSNPTDNVPNTTIVSRTLAMDVSEDEGNHLVDDLVSGGIDGTGMKISSVMRCRLYRDGANAADTFTGKVYLGDIDAHYEVDSDGSRQIWIK